MPENELVCKQLRPLSMNYADCYRAIAKRNSQNWPYFESPANTFSIWPHYSIKTIRANNSAQKSVYAFFTKQSNLNHMSNDSRQSSSTHLIVVCITDSSRSRKKLAREHGRMQPICSVDHQTRT
ncbi:unnamed protein product [Anisakis simplex]|uniref:Uncharacterized protein n=1 Tax=Anisakis simplex TaxID=6269 RepID=A0A0M3JLX9_ANISI|nr:unnamed protein product [Anisakis simplex]